jgi:hypothetical protein
MSSTEDVHAVGVTIEVDPDDVDASRHANPRNIKITSPVGGGWLGLRIEDGRLAIEAYGFGGNIGIEAMPKDLDNATRWRAINADRPRS